jgi:hypothetical protein
VVLGHQRQRPAVQHAAGRVDLGHRRAHAQFDRLGRGAVVQAELAVDAQQDRLRFGGLERHGGGQQAGAGEPAEQAGKTARGAKRHGKTLCGEK